MMVLYGKKTWWMLRPEVLDATQWTVATGYDTERVTSPVTPPPSVDFCRGAPWRRLDCAAICVTHGPVRP